MTNEERMRAFRMRVEGATWEQVSEALNYSLSCVYQDMTACLHAPPRTPRIVYPAIRRLVMERYGGNVTAFAADCGGISPGRLRKVLGGQCALREDTARALAEAAGLDAGTAFRREEGL